MNNNKAIRLYEIRKILIQSVENSTNALSKLSELSPHSLASTDSTVVSIKYMYTQ